MRKFLIGALLMTLAMALTSVTSAASGTEVSEQKPCSYKPWYTHKNIKLGKRIAFHTPWQVGGKIWVKKTNTAKTGSRELSGTSNGLSVGADFRFIRADFNGSHSSKTEISRKQTTAVTVGHAYKIRKGVKARIVVMHRYTMMKTFKKKNIYPCTIVRIYWTKLKCPRKRVHATYRLQCARGGFDWCEKG